MRWKYLIEELSLERPGGSNLDDERMSTIQEALDEVGKGGWEAVAVLPNTETSKFYLLFKKPDPD